MEPSFEPTSEPRHTVEISSPKTSRPFWQKVLFLAVLIAIVSVFIFAVSALINKNSGEETKKTSETAEKKQATESAKASDERCAPLQDLNNNQQGYLACFETLWKQKELKVSGLEIGLAMSDIGDNFPGTINIAITDKSEDLVTQDASNNSSKFEFGKVNVDGVKSTQLVLTRSRDDSLIAYPRAIIT